MLDGWFNKSERGLGRGQGRRRGRARPCGMRLVPSLPLAVLHLASRLDGFRETCHQGGVETIPVGVGCFLSLWLWILKGADLFLALGPSS